MANNNYFKVKHGLIVEGPLTASFAFTTASWAENAITSAFALNFNPSATASFASAAFSATTASFASQSFASTSSSYASASDGATSASWASHSFNSETASYALNISPADTASYAVFAEWANSSSYASGSDAAISASFASASLSSSYSVSSSFATTANNLNGFNFNSTASALTNTGSPVIVVAADTGSYIAAFFDYAVASGSNIRAGTVFGSWVNGLITYSEVSNVDVGDTSDVSMSMALAGGFVQLLATNTNTSPWTVRALGRYI